MSPSHLVALDSILWTQKGPVLGKDVLSGLAALAIRRGQIEEITIDKVGRTEGTVYRLLTEMGDVVVPESVSVVTRSGPVPAEHLRSILQNGSTVRMEMVRPIDLPRNTANGRLTKEAARAALGGLSALQSFSFLPALQTSGYSLSSRTCSRPLEYDRERSRPTDGRRSPSTLLTKQRLRPHRA